MNPAPINLATANARRLLAEPGHGIHTFSNGSEAEGWLEPNCERCCHFEMEGVAGENCALEGALLLDLVSPELATLFGWAQDSQWGPRDGWEAPRACPFKSARAGGAA